MGWQRCASAALLLLLLGGSGCAAPEARQMVRSTPGQHRVLQQAQNLSRDGSCRFVNESAACYPDQFCNGDPNGESDSQCEECNKCYGDGCEDCGLTQPGVQECRAECTDLCVGCGEAIAQFLLAVLGILVGLCCLTGIGVVGCCYLCSNKDQRGSAPQTVAMAQAAGSWPSVPAEYQQPPVFTVAPLVVAVSAQSPPSPPYARSAFLSNQQAP